MVGPFVERSPDAERAPEPPSAGTADRSVDICPHLRIQGASWHSSRPLREHRCVAVTPPDLPSTETQQRRCLVGTHDACPRYLAQDAVRRSGWPGTAEELAAFDGRVARRVPRAVAVALDRPLSLAGPLGLPGGSRRLARLVLAAVMIGAAALLVAARFAGGNL